MPKCPTVFGLPVPGSEKEGSSPVYRHPDFVNGELLNIPEENKSLRTVWDIWINSVKLYPKAQCHGKRPIGKDGKALPGFVWKTYEEVHERVKNFSSGLDEFMKPDTSGTMRLVGLMGINSSEWTIAELATLGRSGTTVPLYNTTPVDIMEYLLNQNGCAVVVCDVASTKTIFKAKPGIPGLSTVIVFNIKDKAQQDELKASADKLGLNFFTFDEIEQKGKAKPLEFVPPKPQDVFSFIFTSGSTGMPKGALLTHEADVSVVAASFVNLEKSGMSLKNGGGEYHISYLPSAHIMERAFQINLIKVGGAVGYFQGIREQLVDDIKNLRPTAWPSVPRLLNMIYDKIMHTVKAKGGIPAKLFNKALQTKIAGLRKGKVTHGAWDAIVFKKIKKGLGFDRLKFIVTGSAPIAGRVLDFYRAVFGTYIIEGYGATETCACGSLTHPLHFSSEHVGGPGANVELKLVSLPDMNYLVTDTDHKGLKVKGRGEICVRGKPLMREYYLNPEATKKAIDSDGWYHSGDVGLILPNGTFKIVDRVGNVFKLAIGEYVAPEKIENIILRSELVASIFAHGDAFHPKMVAVIVPDEGPSMAWAKANGVTAGSLKELCANEKFRQAVIKDMDVVGRKEGLQSYEIPKDCFLESEPWTPDNILTATLKMQRKKALEYYKTQIEKMLQETS